MLQPELRVQRRRTAAQTTLAAAYWVQEATQWLAGGDLVVQHHGGVEELAALRLILAVELAAGRLPQVPIPLHVPPLRRPAPRLTTGLFMPALLRSCGHVITSGGRSLKEAPRKPASSIPGSVGEHFSDPRPLCECCAGGSGRKGHEVCCGTNMSPMHGPAH